VKAPRVVATIERRLLLNYRIDPDVLASVVPAPFRPIVVDGYAVGGICLIRLGGLRPAGFPAAAGLTTENAAHRVAVEWDSASGPVTGVYIPRRDTSSRLVTAVGGRLFPGTHHLARFEVRESERDFQISVAGRDGGMRVVVTAHGADSVMPGSVFRDLDAASQFFRSAPVGYAATPRAESFDGVRLTVSSWSISSLCVDDAESSFFDNARTFPPGSATLDSAFLMSGLESEWTAQPAVTATSVVATSAAAG
jgi:hypothetical protein